MKKNLARALAVMVFGSAMYLTALTTPISEQPEPTEPTFDTEVKPEAIKPWSDDDSGFGTVIYGGEGSGSRTVVFNADGSTSIIDIEPEEPIQDKPSTAPITGEDQYERPGTYNISEPSANAEFDEREASTSADDGFDYWFGPDRD